MKKVLAVAVLAALATPTFAAPSVDWTRDPAGQWKLLSGESFTPAAVVGTQVAPSAPIAAARRPAFGTVTGAMNRAPVDIRFDRRAWAITGGMNRSPVDVRIDHDEKRIFGGANRSPVNLTFTWTPEAFSVEGGANLSPVSLVGNWKDGTLTGHSNQAPLSLQFNLQEGTVTGYANRAPVSLKYDKVSGAVEGYMNRAPVAIRLENLDLSDFLQYFFLFLD